MKKLYLVIFMLACAALGSGGVFAARISDVRNTVHNLSSGASNTVRATLASGQTGTCIFCHTAHGSPVLTPPLWNKTLSVATYTTYTSSSMDALVTFAEGITELAQPDDNSKLCLSCHDGTLAIGALAYARPSSTVPMLGVTTLALPPEGSMPGSTAAADAGANTGYTRRLGVDLRNDHPISVSYIESLALRDGELRAVDSNQKSVSDNGITIGPRDDLGSHRLPLFGPVGSAQVQCPTCHDPHIRDDNTAVVGNQKFLRLNRFQENQPGAEFSEANGDIICLGCHKAGNSWAFSAHANRQVADELYPAVSGPREFPPNLPVWKASCLNCHDTHTVQGAQRLLREGTDNTSIPKAGGNPASEETCFQCHTINTSPALAINLTASVADIWTDYQLGNIRMPLAAQPEVHDISSSFDDTIGGGVNCTLENKCGADFVESRSKLGVGIGNLANRHAECSDCHNPHRVVKFRKFFGNAGVLTGTPEAAGTHSHAAGHTNIASGVLRGMTGVEPVYTLFSFQEMPTSFNFKRGDPGNSANDAASAAHVTREYQVCLKCHSNYGYADNNIYPTGDRPNLGGSGGTASAPGNPNANGLTQFTNQAKEFQAPTSHKGGVTSTTSSGASATYATNNHRSWHPVMDSTGRTPAERGGLAPNTFLPPWNDSTVVGIGTQTMYCSDCHGSATTSTIDVVPDGGENGKPWGPHGSSNNFLLKGLWSEGIGAGTTNALCFRCHDYNQYAADPAPPGAGGELKSGFSCLLPACTTVAPNASNNLHVQHAVRMPLTGLSPQLQMRCSQCHEAVSHGWKNKALLVNLNDVGAEAGNPPLASIVAPYNMQPYYLGARLKVASFARSGEWTASNCAGSCHHL